MKEIAGVIGVSTTTVRLYLNAKRCPSCGGPVISPHSFRCRECAIANLPTTSWTKEEILTRIHEWNLQHGRPPAADSRMQTSKTSTLDRIRCTQRTSSVENTAWTVPIINGTRNNRRVENPKQSNTSPALWQLPSGDCSGATKLREAFQEVTFHSR